MKTYVMLLLFVLCNGAWGWSQETTKEVQETHAKELAAVKKKVDKKEKELKKRRRLKKKRRRKRN